MIDGRTLCLLGLIGFVPSVEAITPSDPDKQSTVVILLDGFRWDLQTPTATPNLERLAKAGTRGEMIPVWPTISTPNHWALVTGLYPSHTGLFHNEMYDPESGKYQKPLEDVFFGVGEPIWAAVARQHGTSGLIGGWAGWRAADASKSPSWRMPYSIDEQGHDNRATLLLQILDQKAETRPDLTTLVFFDVDHEQHVYGVGSPEANQAIRHVDRVIGELTTGLAARGLDRKVNLVIVADHGMMNVGEGQVIFLDDHIDLNSLAVPPVGGGPVMALWPKPGLAPVIHEKLLNAGPHLQAFRPGEIPENRKCCGSWRMPPILVTVDPGWIVTTRARSDSNVKGMHGYDHTRSEMHALFIAAGPAIRAGVQLKPFRNVDVYSLLAELLKIEPAKNDGSIDSLCPILVHPPAACTASPAASQDSSR